MESSSVRSGAAAFATRPIGPVVHAGIGASCIECTGRNPTRASLVEPAPVNAGGCPSTWPGTGGMPAVCGVPMYWPEGATVGVVVGIGDRRRARCGGAGLLLVAEAGEKATAAALLDLGRTGDLHRPGARRGLVADDRGGCTSHRRAHAHFFLWHASAFPARSSEPRIPARAKVVRCRIINASPSSEPSAESRPSGLRVGRLPGLGVPGNLRRRG